MIHWKEIYLNNADCRIVENCKLYLNMYDIPPIEVIGYQHSGDICQLRLDLYKEIKHALKSISKHESMYKKYLVIGNIVLSEKYLKLNEEPSDAGSHWFIACYYSKVDIKHFVKLEKHIFIGRVIKFAEQFYNEKDSDFWSRCSFDHFADSMFHSVLLRTEIDFKLRHAAFWLPLHASHNAIKKYACDIRNGFIDIRTHNAKFFLLDMFKDIVARKLKNIATIYSTMVREDSLLFNLLRYIHIYVNSEKYSGKKEFTFSKTSLSLDDLMDYYNYNLPLCMKLTLNTLTTTNYLKYDARFQIIPFLKDIGYSAEDVKELFQYYLHKAGKRNMVNELMYYISYIYGEVGKKQEQRSMKCRTIVNKSCCNVELGHGCPFSIENSNSLKEVLIDDELSDIESDEIVRSSRIGYSEGCKKYFEIKCKIRTPEKIGYHPLSYFYGSLNSSKRKSTKKLNDI